MRMFCCILSVVVVVPRCERRSGGAGLAPRLPSEPGGSAAAGRAVRRQRQRGKAVGLGRELRSGAAQPERSPGGQMASAAF